MMNALIPLAHTFAPLCKSIPVDIKPGIYFDMPRETYDSIPALNATVVRKFRTLATRPSKFAHWLIHRWAEPISDALLMGDALDTLLLNGAHFDDRFAVIPETAPRKPDIRQRQAKNPSSARVAAIAYWDKFQKQAEGKHFLSADQYQVCLMMRRALHEADSTHVFDHCRKAVLVGTLFGYPAKAELDLWNEQVPHIMDLKKSIDVSPEGFFYAIHKYGYFEQATWYLLLAQSLGFEKDSFSFVTVEEEEPWCVQTHSFAPRKDPKHDMIFRALEARLERIVNEIVDRLETRNFQDNQEWKLIECPEWYLIQLTREVEYSWQEVP
jgi:hypothetical protein